MRGLIICKRCNGAGSVVVDSHSDAHGGHINYGSCPSCKGMGYGAHEVVGTVATREAVDALQRVLRHARIVEEKMTREAREAKCDILHDEHEQLRTAIHNYDALVRGAR